MADKTTQSPSTPLENDTNSAASQLSALIDGELEEREIGLVLHRLGRNPDSRDRWERYHLISDALQGHLPDPLNPGFAERIRQAVEAEPLPQPAAKPLPAWHKPALGFGLAASVLLMTVLGFNLTQSDNPLPASAIPRLALAPPSSAALQPPTGHAEEPAEVRLNNYLVNHNSYASLNSVPGMLPYARMVGYQIRR